MDFFRRMLSSKRENAKHFQNVSDEISNSNGNSFGRSSIRKRSSKTINNDKEPFLMREDINFYFAAILVCPSLLNHSLGSADSSTRLSVESSANQRNQYTDNLPNKTADNGNEYRGSGQTFYRSQRSRSSHNRQPCIYVKEPINEVTADTLRHLKNLLDAYRSLVTLVQREKPLAEGSFSHVQSFTEKGTPQKNSRELEDSEMTCYTVDAHSKSEEIIASKVTCSTVDVHTSSEEVVESSSRAHKKEKLQQEIHCILKQLHLEDRFKEELQNQCLENSDYHKAQQVVPGIFVSSFYPASNRFVLLSLGITHIVCCVGITPPFVHSFDYLVISIDDLPTSNIKRYFPQAVSFIRKAVATGGRVLIHCGAGISRSPTVCAAFLISELLISSDLALQLIRTARPFAEPNAGFLMQLHEWEEQLKHKRLEESFVRWSLQNGHQPASEDLGVKQQADHDLQKPPRRARSYSNSPYCRYPYLYHSESSIYRCDDISTLSMVYSMQEWSDCY